jgi:hypothetical protein
MNGKTRSTINPQYEKLPYKDAKCCVPTHPKFSAIIAELQMPAV